MAQNPNPSLLDPGQIIKRVFDGTEDRIRVDAEVTAVIAGAQEVIINAVDDNIAIRSSSTGYELEPNSDGTINTLTKNSLINVKWDAVSVAYPNSTTEIYTYKLGGLGGTTVASVTIVYTDSTKALISSLVKV